MSAGSTPSGIAGNEAFPRKWGADRSVAPLAERDRAMSEAGTSIGPEVRSRSSSEASRLP